MNDMFTDWVDPIESEEDGADYLSNSGYMLGLPFLRAFNILLDFEANQVSFAQKKNNFGAILTGYNSPGWVEPVTNQTISVG